MVRGGQRSINDGRRSWRKSQLPAGQRGQPSLQHGADMTARVGGESAGRGGVRWRGERRKSMVAIKILAEGAIRSDFGGEIGARPGRRQGPGVHGSNKKKRKSHKELAAIADGDPRLIDKRLLLQCSATILSSCVMQCSWQASSGSARRDWGRCSVDDGSRRAKARVVRWNMQAGWLFDGSLVELVRGLRS